MHAYATSMCCCMMCVRTSIDRDGVWRESGEARPNGAAQVVQWNRLYYLYMKHTFLTMNRRRRLRTNAPDLFSSFSDQQAAIQRFAAVSASVLLVLPLARYSSRCFWSPHFDGRAWSVGVMAARLSGPNPLCFWVDLRCGEISRHACHKKK